MGRRFTQGNIIKTRLNVQQQPNCSLSDSLPCFRFKQNLYFLKNTFEYSTFNIFIHSRFTGLVKTTKT